MKLGLRIAISAGVLALLLVLLPWPEVRAAIGRMPPALWAGVLAGFLAGHGIGTAKWRLLVNAGRSGLRAIDAVRCYAAGLFANLCLPSIVGGDVLRAVLAGRATGRPEAVVLGGVTDRMIDIAALGLLLAAGMLSAGAALPGGALLAAVAMLAGGAAAGGGALLLLLRRPLRRWPRRVRRPLARALVALRRLARAPSAALVAFLLALAIQGGFVLLNAWIGRGIGITAPLGAWFLAWSFAKLAGLLPISLGGLGVRDATLAALLVPFGVPTAQGVVASLVWQSVLIAGGLIAGGVWWGLGRRLRTPGRLRPVSVPASAT